MPAGVVSTIPQPTTSITQTALRPNGGPRWHHLTAILLIVLGIANLSYSAATTPLQKTAPSNLVVKLGWDANQEQDLAGYRLHYGFESRIYSLHIDVGNTNQASLNLPFPKTTYYIALTAYNHGGLESTYSNEVVYEASEAPISIETISRFGSTLEDTPFVIPIPDNPNTSASDWFLTKSPSHGQVEMLGGQLTYTPTADFSGTTDTFELVISVGSAVAIRQQWSIEIRSENDPPTAFDLWTPTQPNVPIEVLLEGYDPEGSPLRYELLTQPEKGRISGTPPQLIYTPRDDMLGADSFQYIVYDGASTSSVATVFINISTIEIEPYARDSVLSLNEDEPLSFTLDVASAQDLSIRVSDPPDFGTILGEPPHLTYVPFTNYFGSDAFVFEVEDSAGRVDVAVVLLEVQAVNDPPVARPLHISVPYDQPPRIELAASDPDEDSLRFEVVDPPSAGSLTGSPPNLTYHPASGEIRRDSFTFRVYDGTHYSPPAAVNLNLQSPPTPGPSIHASFTATGQLLLRWNILSGRSYRVLFRKSLNDPDWIPLSSDLVSENDSLEYAVELPPGSPVGFFCVQLQPR